MQLRSHIQEPLKQEPFILSYHHRHPFAFHSILSVYILPVFRLQQRRILSD